MEQRGRLGAGILLPLKWGALEVFRRCQGEMCVLGMKSNVTCGRWTGRGWQQAAYAEEQMY